ncbi:hypothetical protein SKAU_G00145860 [Synaphobranchus kaupii]|uniref:Uncharacterized protein n=1 Tax=Synaphobranchus kaupii TaxID=118154 RepID=A0A9Q1FT75_SYNKA|nr:hypothetical protein SKAU_G00145860 [Synaphobranchus kaupii]
MHGKCFACVRGMAARRSSSVAFFFPPGLGFESSDGPLSSAVLLRYGERRQSAAAAVAFHAFQTPERRRRTTACQRNLGKSTLVQKSSIIRPHSLSDRREPTQIRQEKREARIGD